MSAREGAAGPAWRAGAVLALAFSVRTLYLLSIRGAYFFEHLVTEPQRYDAWARDIVLGAAPARPPFDEAPAYAYFVAAIYRFAGHHAFAVASVQALMDAASCAAIAAFAQRAFGDRAAWIAGVLAALYAPMIYFTGQLEPATLTVFAVSLALWATPLDRDAPARRWAYAGAAWAFALLVRSELLLALPLALWHARLAGGRRAWTRLALAPAALLALSFVVNLASSGHAVLLTTGSGVNLWIGNNPAADGVDPFVSGPLAATAGRIEAQTRDAVVADALFRREALSFFADSPGHALRLALRKLLWLWTDRELPNAADIDWQTRQSWIFLPPLFPLRFGAILPVACAGAFFVRGSWRRLLVVYAPVAVAVIVAVAFFTNARFRLVLSPSLLLLAAAGIDGAWPLLKRGAKGRRALIRPVLAAIVGLALGWSNFDGVRTYRIKEIDENTAAMERAARVSAGRSPR